MLPAGHLWMFVFCIHVTPESLLKACNVINLSQWVFFVVVFWHHLRIRFYRFCVIKMPIYFSFTVVVFVNKENFPQRQNDVQQIIHCLFVCLFILPLYSISGNSMLFFSEILQVQSYYENSLCIAYLALLICLWLFIWIIQVELSTVSTGDSLTQECFPQDLAFSVLVRWHSFDTNWTLCMMEKKKKKKGYFWMWLVAELYVAFDVNWACEHRREAVAGKISTKPGLKAEQIFVVWW